MAIFSWRAQVESSGDSTFTVFSSKFGDGYSQDIPNGLNNEVQTWSVVVKGYRAEVAPVLAFLRERKGRQFQWRAPNTAALGWYSCKQFGQRDEGGDFWTITMKFEQAYAP